MPRKFEVIEALDKAAALSIAAIRKAFEQAVAELRKGIAAGEIRGAIQSRSPDPILASQAWDAFVSALMLIFEDGGPISRTIRSAHRRAMKEVPLKGLKLDMSALDEAIAAYLEVYGADLVVDVTDSTRASIQRVVRDATRGGKTTRQAARMIMDVRGFGLTLREAGAFDVWARKIFDRASNPRSTIFGISKKQIRLRVEKEFAKRIRHRARRIANTEAYTAGNEARRVLWREAVNQGKLDPNEYLLQWVTRVIDVCPRCEALDGKTAEIIDGLFVSDVVEAGSFQGQIITVERPTVHPWCYCSLRTVRREDA